MKTTVSKNLIRLRKKKGLSQDQLAKLAGLTKRQIFYYENEVEDSILKNLEIIAKVLNVNMSELFKDGTENSYMDENILKSDSRTIKKIKDILSLPREERHIIYNITEAFIIKRRVKIKALESDDVKNKISESKS